MFTSPPEQSLEWSESSVEGASRFLKKIWNLIDGRKFEVFDINNDFSKEELSLRRKSHATLKKVENDFEIRFSFNTAIAAIMELLNFIPDSFKSEDASDTQKFCLNETIIFTLKMLFPIAPHISEYLWNNFGAEESHIESSWPKFESGLIEAEEFELIIQVNGKVRGKVKFDKNTSQDKIEQSALTVENVRNFIGSSKIKKTIYVKEKLINFVI
tara:strand:- start:26 stop:667 length:642 start_codon:yes stop_codon:yes gene_type:complete